MTKEEAKSCIGTIEMLQRLAYNIHGVMDVIDADNCNKIIKSLEQEPCENCISRQAVLEWLKDKDFIKTKNQEENARRELADLPSVTPQPKIGHWIDIMVGDMPAQACARCNTFYPLAYTGGGHKYCPNCGAKMEVSE